MKLRPFELGLIIFFVILAIGALVLLTNPPQRSGDDEGLPVIGQVNIWGTLPSNQVRSLIDSISDVDDRYENVTYSYLQARDLEDRLVNAIAAGSGPDLVLYSHEQLVEIRRWLQPISYESFPQRDIRNIYIAGASIFALNDGLYARPVAVNPMVMYWNRDILTNAGYLTPPATWEELVNSVLPDLIERDSARNIQRSVVAMGEYDNIRRSFGILSTLILQGGSSGVATGADGNYQIALNQGVDGTAPMSAALNFYTRFSRAENAWYSWNRSFSEDRERFLSGDLVFYFGFVTEAREIERANPNLNFDIAEMPQDANASVRRTYGNFYGYSLMRTSRNPVGARAVMDNLASVNNSNTLATSYGLVPVYINLVAAGSNDIYGRLAYSTAPVTYGWLSPNRLATDQVFEIMVEDVISNRRGVDSAVRDALQRLGQEY